MKFYLSGGAANADPNASIGGAISNTEFVDNTVGNLFADVLGPEGVAGSTKYRCLYFKNTNGSLTAQNAKLFLVSNTPSTDDTAEIAKGAAAINATETAVANEDTAPSGPTFSAPSSYATGILLGNIPSGQYQAFWIKRIVTGPIASAYNNNTIVYEVDVDSAA